MGLITYRSDEADFEASEQAAETGRQIQRASEKHFFDEQERFLRQPRSTAGRALDILARGQYFSTAIADSLIGEGPLALGGGIMEGLDEAFSPEDRVSYADLIRKYAPGFAERNPIGTTVLGLAGDIVLDPTTWLTFGAGGAANFVIKGGRALPRVAKLAKAVETIPAGANALNRSRALTRAASKGALRGSMNIEKVRLSKSGLSLVDEFAKEADELGHVLNSTGLKARNKLADTLLKNKSAKVKAGEYTPLDAMTEAENLLRNRKFGSGHRQLDGQIFTAVDTKVRVSHATNRVKDILQFATQAEDIGAFGKIVPKLNDLEKVGGIRFAGKWTLVPEVITSNLGATVAKATGITALRTSMIGVTSRRLFNKNHVGVPQELKDHTRALYASLDNLEAQVAGDVLKFFGGFDEAARVRIGRLGQHVDDAFYTNPEVKQWISSGQHEKLAGWINNEARVRFGLKQPEIDHYHAMRKKFEDMRRIEVEAGLLNREVSNYFPRYYKVISDANGMRKLRGRLRLTGSVMFDRDIARKITTLADARRMGLEPIEDSVLLYTRRLMAHERVMRVQNFKDAAARVLDDLDEAGAAFRDAAYRSASVQYRNEVKNTTQRFGSLWSLGRKKNNEVMESMRLDYLRFKAKVRADETSTRIAFVSSKQMGKKRPTAAWYNRKANTLYIDQKVARKAWETKAWTNPKVEGVRALPENQFSSYDEWEDFLTQHELAHIRNPQKKGEAKHVYENRINDLALKTIRDRPDFTDELAEFTQNRIVKKEMSAAETRKFNKMLTETDRRRVDVQQYIDHVGDGVYNSATGQHLNDAFRVYDRMMRAFRLSATIVRPAFSARQYVGNSFQSFIEGGVGQTVRQFDPRTIIDAGLVVRGHAAKFGVRTNLGTFVDGETLHQAMKEYGVLKNVTVEGTSVAPMGSADSAARVRRMLDRKIAKSQGKYSKADPADAGMRKLLASVWGNYMSAPAMVEDFARASFFINQVRAGQDFATAARSVDNALFDYLSGLTAFEERAMKRLIPFYSYQRFAGELLARAVVHTPGRVSNAAKTGRALMGVYGKIIGGEELTPNERGVLPGWLVEQPAEFAGFDRFMRANFKLFNNFTPLDIFSFVRETDHGELDVRQTLIQASLAQITPYVKVPLEVLINRDFFTGRALDDLANVGDIDEDKFLASIVSSITATFTGGTVGSTVAAAGGYGLTNALANVDPDTTRTILRGLLGAEEGVDPKTGTRTLYVSPYRMHILTSFFPGLNDFIRSRREDRTATEKAMHFLFGVNTAKVDLAEEQARALARSDSRIEDADLALEEAIRTQQHFRMQQAQRELQDAITTSAQEYRFMTGQVRAADRQKLAASDHEAFDRIVAGKPRESFNDD